jgi:signal transduction histidine kinase
LAARQVRRRRGGLRAAIQSPSMASPCFGPPSAAEPATQRSGRALLRASWRAWWSPAPPRVGPAWLQFGWTFLFNTAIAVVLTLIAWSFAQRSGLLQLFKWNWVIAQSIGFSIHLLFEAAGRLIGTARIEAFDTPRRVVFFAGIPIVGCLLGYWVGLSLLGVQVARLVQGAPRVVIGIIAVSIIVSTFWYRYTVNRARLAAAEAERERERSRGAELERLALDAQLRSLQAQIEPHFLFNTLANVVSLIDASPDKARRMLERLIDLLRASLAASRAQRTSLGQEAALVAAYLDILAVRMGERLRYTIDVPPELAAAAVPPLTLQPLVENAIRHGLEPKLAGGTLAVRARATDGALQLDVDDDGLGFGDPGGAGVGIDNLRDRLAAAYGARARLAISDLAPGTRVRVTLPLDDR